MKTASPIARLLTIAACAITPLLQAAPHINFSDTWKDTLLYDKADQSNSVQTTGAFTMSFSLPLAGAQISANDPIDGGPSQVSVGIIPAGEAYIDVVAADFGQATSLSMVNHTASFRGYDDSTGGPIGHADFSWAGGVLNCTVTIPKDILAREGVYTTNAPSISDTCDLEVIFSQFGYDNPLVKISGKNTETYAASSNGLYQVGLGKGSIQAAGIAKPPKLTVTSPPGDVAVYDADPVVKLKGTASDTEPLASISIWLDDGEPVNIDQTNALGTNINWTASVDLRALSAPGPTKILITATDVSGNSAAILRRALWLETNAADLIINPPGAGKIVGLTQGQRVYVGDTYHLQAVPSSNSWIVSYWGDTNGNVFGQGSTLDYVYPASGPLVLNFVSSPFPMIAGLYTATIQDQYYPDPTRNGYLTMTVEDTGAFSGRCWFPSQPKPYPFSGSFFPSDPSTWEADIYLAPQSSNPIYLQMWLASDENSPDVAYGFLAGNANWSDGWEDPITGEIVGWPDSTNIVAGDYNVALINFQGDPDDFPAGYGALSARLSSNNAVSMTFNVGDGISPSISFNTWISPDGTFPIYAPLYGGKGYLLGTLQFWLDGSHEIHDNGSLEWLKTPAVGGFYTNGYQLQPFATGVPYLPPKKGTNLFGDTDLNVIIDYGFQGQSLPDEIDVPVTFNPEKNAFVDTNEVRVQLKPAMGTLTGSFLWPGTKRTTPFHGLVVGNVGYGFYAGTNHEVGAILLGTPQVLADQLRQIVNTK